MTHTDVPHNDFDRKGYLKHIQWQAERFLKAVSLQYEAQRLLEDAKDVREVSVGIDKTLIITVDGGRYVLDNKELLNKGK